MQLKPRCWTITEALLRLVDCSRYGARFISKSNEATFYPYHEVARRAQLAAGTLQKRGLKPGDRVALILPTSIQFLDTFLGIQLAGGIPAALYPPLRLGRLREYFTRSRRMLEQIGARFLIAESQVMKMLGPAVDGVGCLEGVIDAGKLLGSANWVQVEIDPESPAFLQFSSGTTGEPRAVMVSHKNLMWNLEMINHAFVGYNDDQAEQGGVCWLPLYHDMGLVGCMFFGIYHPGTVTYLRPEVFISRPALWLQTISRYKAVVSAAPSFAYAYCFNKIKDADMAGVDLSSWSVSFNGAEPIDVEAMRNFSTRFANWSFRAIAMRPVYGLAEAGLAVTFTEPLPSPLVTEFDRRKLSEEGRAVPGRGRTLPTVGHPLPGVEIAIRGKDDQRLEPGLVGKIMVKGPSISKGYFNNPDLTSQTIRDGWLDTGDLGFLYEDSLYLTGREKDLIIVRGRNYAPQEIEELLARVEGLRPGCAIATSCVLEGLGEQLIVLAETQHSSVRTDEELVAEIRERILSGISLAAYHVQILEPGTLLRTSSGKLRRQDSLRSFLAGELLPPKKMGALRLSGEIGKSQIAWARFWLQKRWLGRYAALIF